MTTLSRSKPLKFAPGLHDEASELEKPYQNAQRWIDADLIRFWRGQPRVIGGWSKYIADQLTGKARGLLIWTNATFTQSVGVGTHSNLYIVQGGSLYDITPAGLAAGNENGTSGGGYGAGAYGEGNFGEGDAAAGYPRTWSLRRWGDYMLANPRGGTIYEWQGDTGVVAAALSNAPAVVDSFTVTNERHVMCFGADEEVSASFNPMLLRWSDREDNNDWTTTSANSAGEKELTVGSRLVAGVTHEREILAWSDEGLYRIPFVGGNAVYDPELVADGCGLIGPKAYATRDGVAYWLSSALQFFVYRGGKPTPIDCPIRDDMIDNLAPDQLDKIEAGMNTRFNEVWWFYPDARDIGSTSIPGLADDDAVGENSRYVALNLNDGTWTRGKMSRTAWRDAKGSITVPIAVSGDGYIYQHEDGNTADGGVMSPYVESGFIDGETSLIMCHGMSPDFYGQQGAVACTIKSRMEPNGDDIEFGPFTFATNSQRQSFEVLGRMLKFRFHSSASPTAWRLGDPHLDLRVTEMQL